MTEDQTDHSTRDKFNFQDDVVAVTGGARGIGEQTCRNFSKLGANVAVVDVAIDTARELAGELTSDSSSAIAIETDVSSYDDAQEMVETVIDEFGRLDVLVNNAGLGTVKPFAESTVEEWDETIGVSYYGTLNCSHAVLPHMREQESGVIINFASDAYKGNDPGTAVYGGAKAANVSFSKTLAKEVGSENIRVNCVSPGTTRTPASEDWIDEYGDQLVENYALNRLGQPSDLADAIAFLASDAAEWITGEVLSVNGGYHKG
jgi:NAD(P)-dependent dehydrogenase (short-subunit alcohol dehydrogenase family)